MTISSDDARFKHIEADGQPLLVARGALLDELLATDALDGRPLGSGRLFQQYADLAKATAGLDVALGSVREANQPWWVYHVVERNGVFVRVMIESARCDCGFRGLAGNPRDFSIYIGTEDPLAAMLSHDTVDRLPCPQCRQPLARPCVFLAPPPSA